ncbi:TPA: hypothetical protein ACHT5R_001704 [Citrobacter freundii]
MKNKRQFFDTQTIIDVDVLEALLDENYRLTAERDALRENIGGDNTRAAADIYFQLVEECEIPPGGSLVGYVDDIKERLSNAENHSAEMDNALCELLPGTQYMDPPDDGSVTPLEQVRRMVADYLERMEAAEKRIDELESNEIREDGNQFLVVRHPGKTPAIKHCSGDLEEFLRQLIEQDPLVTIDIITHRHYGVGGQWVQDGDEYLHMMTASVIGVKGE